MAAAWICCRMSTSGELTWACDHPITNGARNRARLIMRGVKGFVWAEAISPGRFCIFLKRAVLSPENPLAKEVLGWIKIFMYSLCHLDAILTVLR